MTTYSEWFAQQKTEDMYQWAGEHITTARQDADYDDDIFFEDQWAEIVRYLLGDQRAA
jgi:hypothetical protein